MDDAYTCKCACHLEGSNVVHDFHCCAPCFDCGLKVTKPVQHRLVCTAPVKLHDSDSHKLREWLRKPVNIPASIMSTPDPDTTFALLHYMIKCLEKGLIPDPIIISQTLNGTSVPACGLPGCNLLHKHSH